MAMKTIGSLRIHETLEDFCTPERMALVVYDMQAGIIAQLPHGSMIVARVARILDAARRGGFKVVFLRHLSMPRELMGAFQYRQAMAWQRIDDPAAVTPWFQRGAASRRIVAELAPRESEAVLDKITFSAFEGTPLAMILRDCGLVAFALCGVAMEIGIEPTARHGADLGLTPLVVADACGAGHNEAAARALANLAFMGDAVMTDEAALIAAMDASRERIRS